MYCVIPLRNVIMYIAWCTSGTIEQKTYPRRKSVHLLYSTLINVLCCTAS